MRMRFKPYARPELAAWPCAVKHPAALRGHWAAAFAKPSLPLRLELGCGKGGFLARQALAGPGYNWLGLDIKSEMLVVAKRNAERLFAEAGRDIANLLIASWEIERIEAVLAPEDAVERVYINFCNPWPKSRDAKHRLTHPRQLLKYRAFMRPDAELWLKTDHERLFSDSLRYLAMTGFDVRWQSRNLLADEPNWNIRTEHEAMFAAEGKPIFACVAALRPARLDEAAISKWKTV